MAPDEATASAPPSPGSPEEATLVAAAVRAGIDALLAERAPAERDAFWRAVALLYARGNRPDEPPGLA